MVKKQKVVDDYMAQISVIVPVYNVEKYIHRCVESIRAQTLTDFELILVDDGSPDNCGEICDEYAEKDNRIVVIHKKNGGLSDARNAGIDWSYENSDSQWIAFIDSDDWVNKMYLEKLIHAVISGNVSISICDYESVSSCTKTRDTGSLDYSIEDSEFAFTNMYAMCMPAWGKLYSKELFRDIRFPVGRIHEDAFVTPELLFCASKVAIISQKLYYYQINDSGISHSKWIPKRIDEVDAHNRIVKLLKEKHYKDCLLKEREVFLHLVANQVSASSFDKEYIDYNKRLRKKLRRLIFQYRYSCSRTIRGNEWIYELAYPKTINIYYYYIAFLKKIGIYNVWNKRNNQTQ